MTDETILDRAHEEVPEDYNETGDNSIKTTCEKVPDFLFLVCQ